MIMAQEIALLKAKEEFQKIEETIRQATMQRTRIFPARRHWCRESIDTRRRPG